MKKRLCRDRGPPLWGHRWGADCGEEPGSPAVLAAVVFGGGLLTSAGILLAKSGLRRKCTALTACPNVSHSVHLVDRAQFASWNCGFSL